MRNTLLGQIIRESVGDWRYPLIRFSWWLAKILVPRRKVNISGTNFTLSCTNWITHFRWYLFKTKEPETIYFFDKYLSEGDTYFDIGANVGVFSIYPAKKIDDIKIYSFEPEASNLAYLKENLIENGITEKVIIYGLGISDSVGLSKLHLQDLTPGAAMHSENQHDIDFSFEGQYPIKWAEGIYTVSLDYFCKELNIIPNIIKIDTDGNENKILRGAINILKNSEVKAILIETPKDQIEECHSILLKCGFKLEEYDFIKSQNEFWIRKEYFDD